MIVVISDRFVDAGRRRMRQTNTDDLFSSASGLEESSHMPHGHSRAAQIGLYTILCATLFNVNRHSEPPISRTGLAYNDSIDAFARWRNELISGVHAKHVRWLTARVPAGGQPRGRGLASTVTTDNVCVHTISGLLTALHPLTLTFPSLAGADRKTRRPAPRIPPPAWC